MHIERFMIRSAGPQLGKYRTQLENKCISQSFKWCFFRFCVLLYFLCDILDFRSILKHEMVEIVQLNVLNNFNAKNLKIKKLKK